MGTSRTPSLSLLLMPLLQGSHIHCLCWCWIAGISHSLLVLVLGTASEGDEVESPSKQQVRMREPATCAVTSASMLFGSKHQGVLFFRHTLQDRM